MKLLATLATVSLIVAPTLATPCRDAKGHFTKCLPAAAVPAAVTKDAKGRCRGAGGKFVACPK